MTTIQQAAEFAVRSARRAKEDQARKRDSDLPVSLFAYRGQDLVAMVWPTDGTRDKTLAAVRTVAVGFGADVLAMTMDTWQGTGRTNPLTGKSWGAGDLQDLVENHDGYGRGWVTDAVSVLVYNRAGDRSATMLPYRIASRNVVWLDDRHLDTEDGYGGLVHEVLSAAMSGPTLDVLVARTGLTGADFGLDAEETLAHQDCAAAKLLLNRCAVALAAEPNTVRAKIIRRSLPDGKVIRP